ncbi:Phosphatase [Candidatus Desulfarcum epimagneticum]|uniref:Phosphatase n=1 Tax=uncultured Desulfobacteraceae bacterium TaxID=218296 RepID=A0A484HEC7_9BACT|nr:Phosphatase [uncultured Desulfobacteraceae bacterium]
MESDENQTAIDLHIHSLASDGTLSAAEIISLAEKLGLGAVAITDHDAIEGSREALGLVRPDSLGFLTGVEISVEPPPGYVCRGSVHILGYGVHPDDDDLNRSLERMRKARKERNPKIIEKLNALGMDISMSDVRSRAGGGQVGRPHIAQCMLDAQLVRDIPEAFDRYLAKGKPAYVDKSRLTCRRAIEIIRKAGGIASLAHPFLVQPSGNHDINDLIAALKSMGLGALETYYTEHSPEIQNHYARLADRFGLLPSGGSDFHGDAKPEVRMGAGKGDLSVPFSVYENLKNALSSAP